MTAATDACHPDEPTAPPNPHERSSDDATQIHQPVREPVRHATEKFDADGEKFYPSFFDTALCDDTAFKNLNRKYSVMLGFEVANSVPAHLNGTITPESPFSKICEFTEKERNIIKSISGYVMK